MIRWLFENTVRPAQLALRERVSLRIDRKLNVRTTDEVIAEQLGVDIGVFRNTQRALGWSGAVRLVRRMDLRPSDVLLDIGCGAGRILCAAARTPVRRVIGLDIDPKIAAIARENARHLQGRQAEIEVVEGNALSYEIPDDVTVVFLYNPFGGEVFSSVLKRLIEAADRAPRQLHLVYAHPFEHERVMQLKRFIPGKRLSLGWRPGKKWAVKLAVQFYRLQGRKEA